MTFNSKIYTIQMLLGIASVLIEANVLVKRECPSLCPALFAPICATNGESYTEFGNPCILQTSNCRMDRNKLKQFVETEMEWCRTTHVENMNSIYDNLDLSRAECMKPCTLIYAPLCVANDKYRTTISNKCILELYNCVLGLNGAETLFKVLKGGSC